MNLLFRALTAASLSAVFIIGTPSAELYAAARQNSTQTTRAKKKQGAARRSGSGSNAKAKTASKPKGKANTGPKSSTEARRLQEAAQRDIVQTKEKIRLNDQQIKEGLADLNQLSSEIKTGRQQVETLRGKVSALQGEITEINGAITKNEAELQRMRAEYLKAVKKMRLNRKNQSMLAFIFASDDFNQALRRMRYIRQFSDWREKKSGEINAMTATLSAEREKLDRTKQQHSASLGLLTATQADLETKHRKQAQLVEGLKQNGSALQTHLANKQNEANQLKSTIATLIAQEQAKAEAQRLAREKAEAERLERERAEAARLEQEKADAEQAASLSKAEKKKAEEERKAREKKQEAERKAAEKKRKEEEKREKKERKARKKNERKKADSKVQAREPERTDSKASATISGAPANFATLKGKLRRPVDGNWRITNPFGRHAMPELPQVVYDNPGIDAEVAKGTSVKAVAGGRVSGVYKLQGYGNVVIVSHGEYYTVYGNLASVSVAVGNQLSAGQTVGSAAADPDDQRRGSVHFEVWHGREKQNPEAWVR